MLAPSREPLRFLGLDAEHYGATTWNFLDEFIRPSMQTQWIFKLSGPALGKPPKNLVLSCQAKKQECQDICDRNVVEGIFGTGKTTYGLGRVVARLQETAVCVIGVVFLLLNLSTSLRVAFALFSFLPVLAILLGLWSRAYLIYFSPTI